jgi:hypothetical protein
MGLLDGTIPASWLLGITASNVFLHPEFARVNSIKARLPLPLTRVYRVLAGNWFDCVSKRHDKLVQRVLNQLLRFYPTGSASELCTSVVCHRSELAFGRLWSHRNMGDATHDELDRFLGGTSMAALSHLVRMGVTGEVLDSEGHPLISDASLENLRDIPILFFSGTENAVFTPEATLTSYTKLRAKFGEVGYERLEFEAKGHLDCWMGEDASVRGGVFDQVRKRVDAVCARGKVALPIRRGQKYLHNGRMMTGTMS